MVFDSENNAATLTGLFQACTIYLTVASGSSMRIDYRDSPPVLALKLREMVDCEQCPRRADDVVTAIVQRHWFCYHAIPVGACSRNATARVSSSFAGV
jgi:hypothetical protein